MAKLALSLADKGLTDNFSARQCYSTRCSSCDLLLSHLAGLFLGNLSRSDTIGVTNDTASKLRQLYRTAIATDAKLWTHDTMTIVLLTNS
jgi:hypothetical protein